MSSGVLRPYTLVDVIGALNSQNSQQQGSQTVNGLGDFGEVDESVPVVDSVTATAQVNPGWDQGQWGAFTWS